MSECNERIKDLLAGLQQQNAASKRLDYSFNVLCVRANDSREELAKFLSQGYNRCALVSKT